jgi:uncharacterized protein YraI
MRPFLKTGSHFLLFFGSLGLLFFRFSWTASSAKPASEPTPTVTSVPNRAFITVTYIEPINVRAGPGSFDYPIIGSIPVGGTATAVGRSPAGEWIQIDFPGGARGVGWVYAANVSLSANALLPVVEPPPTAVPATTATVNPTFAAALQTAPTSTRLPTFTAPPALAIPTYVNAGATTSGKVQTGWIIIGLALAGLLGMAIASLRRR